MTARKRPAGKIPKRWRAASVRLVALLALAASVFAAAALGDESQASSATATKGKGAAADYAIETSTLVEDVASTRRPTASGADGAFGPNYRWEQGEAKSWNIAFQRVGESDVIYGIVTGQPHYINLGLKTFNWAFAREAPDGSFPTAASSLYQYGMFVAAASRASLLLQHSRYGAEYRPWLEAHRDLLHQAAAYMATPAMLKQGAWFDRRNTHRLYINALAFTLAARLSGDKAFNSDADAQIKAALKRQEPGGVNPESGGHDSTYQALGIYEAEQWLVYERGDALAGRVRQMVIRGLEWERSRIGTDGQLKRGGDTRTDGQEISPFTQGTKGPSYITIVRALSYWAVRDRESAYGRIARSLARRHLGAARA